MVDKSSKQNLYLSVSSLLCLILSLVVFYPLSMEADEFSNLIPIIFALSFYIFQGLSFILAIVAFARVVFMPRLKRQYLNLISLLITTMVFATFVYELYWLLKHI